MVTAS